MGLVALVGVAVSVPDGWAQVKVKLLTDTVGTVVLDCTVVVAVAKQPLFDVTVTEYGPAALTVMEGVFAPVLHKYVGEVALVGVAVSVPVGCAQVSVRLFTLTLGTVVLDCTVVVAVARQPLFDVTVTE